ncbi:DUF3299 domain-containing protein [Chitinophaga sp. SYP-B3965]|uniref:DUF3299 domain-containing protein n=1 Tax=Chitinophaga sp. SYP-B3965 TaxID=2663120 RepID=UPI001299EBAD|nr:DUF3299 domain-containing protein [Chitinophaga sp. SYP-B3965]MRG46749.1 DUF3299 domain-containing protein [Chitinophaga sp. SYP-B3965]
MLKIERLLVAAMAFLMVSCSNVSRYCKHGNFILNFSQGSSLPMSTVYYPDDTAVQKITWKQLSDVIFDRKWDEKMQMPMLYPSFSRTIKALHGKTISISGYVVPVDAKGGMFVLSANPNSSCFFCGGAGPETIMTLKFKSGKPAFETDDYVRFQGRLRLNEKNIYELYYNLDDAVLVTK